MKKEERSEDANTSSAPLNVDTNDLQQSQDVSKRKRDDSQPTSSSRNRSRRNITKKSTRIGKGVRVKM